MRTERFQEALQSAQAVLGTSTTEEEVCRVAKHMYARVLTGGCTIGRTDGKLVVKKLPGKRPKLPG